MTMFKPWGHLIAHLRSLHLFPPSLRSLSHPHLHPLSHGVSVQEAGTKQEKQDEVSGLEQEKERGKRTKNTTEGRKGLWDTEKLKKTWKNMLGVCKSSCNSNCLVWISETQLETHLYKDEMEKRRGMIVQSCIIGLISRGFTSNTVHDCCSL